MIELREITRDNYKQCVNLRVSDNQQNFVASNVFSLTQAKYEPECIPLAIYTDDEMVGFVMYCVDIDDDNYWIYRLMIEEKHQRKGYAFDAMMQVIDIIKQDKTRHKIYIDCKHENIAAQELYAKLGFVRTDEIDDLEVYMRLDY